MQSKFKLGDIVELCVSPEIGLVYTSNGVDVLEACGYVESIFNTVTGITYGVGGFDEAVPETHLKLVKENDDDDVFEKFIDTTATELSRTGTDLMMLDQPTKTMLVLSWLLTNTIYGISETSYKIEKKYFDDIKYRLVKASKDIDTLENKS